jgi:hypothetical protein
MKMRLTILMGLAVFCLGLYGWAGSQAADSAQGAPPDSLPPSLPEGPSVGPDTTSGGPATLPTDTTLFQAAPDSTEAMADTLPLDTVPVPVDTVIISGVKVPVIATGPLEGGRAGAEEEDTGPVYWTARARLKPDKPKFAQAPALSVDFDEGFQSRWREAGTGRTYEARQASLADYSNIDIPIKFPDTIGNVIGQGANLNVSGSERITFGGTSSYQLNEQKTEFGRRSRFPTLDMKQQLKIDLNGTVGEKIHVTVHHDSEIDTPLENRIKLHYDGDEDEIVQSIEMGNTNLSLPGSRFVSYSGQQQGLFGAKVLAKLGGLDLSLIASKQEGRTAGASFKGTATKDSVTISDMDYIRNKYFFMVDPYERTPGAVFTNVTVYLDDGNGNNNLDTGAIPAWAFLNPNEPGDVADWETVGYHGTFDVLTINEDYAVDLQTGEIALLRPLGDAYALAVTYTYGGVQVGVPVGDDKRLKMIRPPSTYMIEREDVWKAPTLKLMRKNVYSLGARYISEEKVEVRIFRRASPVDEELQGDLVYAKILGIDLQDENGHLAEPPLWQTDGYADGGTINGELGLLIFPALRPFDPQVIIEEGLPPLADTNPIIYDEHINKLRESNDSKYYITVRYSTPATSFKLNHINILEGSEVVTLNGRRLTRNVDYEIYYDIGQIRFKTDEAAQPDAEILVDYQYVPFLSLAQQSLVGAQGLYRLSDKSHIGSVWLFQGKKSPEERPRLGQEPSQTVMGDFNGNIEFNPSMMTSMINVLPFVDSDKESRLTLAGELGMSLPNPNTKGQVYIDDMEGVQDLRSFSIIREAWVPRRPTAGGRTPGD